MVHDWKLLLLVSRIWQPVTDFWSKTTGWPVVGRFCRYILNEKHCDVTFTPINEELEDAGSAVVPKQVVYQMIERAAN